MDGTDAPSVRANAWMIKQVLATGVHGLLLCHAETAEAVRAFVEAARYSFRAAVGSEIGGGRRGLELDLGYRPKLRRRLRSLVFAHATFAYLAPITLITLLLLFLVAAYVRHVGGGLPTLVTALLLLAIPAADVAIALVQRLIRAGQNSDAIDLARRVADEAPSRPEAWRDLRTVLGPDAQLAQLAIAPLVLLGAAKPDELDAWRSRRAAIAPFRPGAFGLDVLAPLSGLDPNAPILGVLAALPEAAAKLWPLDLESFGVNAREKITTKSGRHVVTVSPDGRLLADVYSYVNRPPDLFLMENRPGATMSQLTLSPSKEWLSFNWIEPETNVRLASLQQGDVAEVSRIGDESPEFLEYVADLGMKPGVSVSISGRAPFNGPLMVRVGEREHALGDEVCSKIWVVPPERFRAGDVAQN